MELQLTVEEVTALRASIRASNDTLPLFAHELQSILDKLYPEPTIGCWYAVKDKADSDYTPRQYSNEHCFKHNKRKYKHTDTDLEWKEEPIFVPASKSS